MLFQYGRNAKYISGTVCQSMCVHAHRVCLTWLTLILLLLLFSFQDITICGHKVNRLKLAQAKLQNDPSKAALKLLLCLFDAEELVNGNPTGSTNSKEEQRQATIKKLDPDWMKYLSVT